MAYTQPGAPIPTKGKGSKLSGKMARFVEEYLVDFVAYKAVLRAGYQTKTPKHAALMAAELLSHPLVIRELDARQAKRRQKLELTAEYVIQKLVSIVEETDTSNPQAALRGLELLGKHLGLYRDRQEISGPDGAAIEMEQKVTEDVADFTSKLSRLAESAGKGIVPLFPKHSSQG